MNATTENGKMVATEENVEKHVKSEFLKELRPVIEQAQTILKKHGKKCMFFVATDIIEEEKVSENETKQSVQLMGGFSGKAKELASMFAQLFLNNEDLVKIMDKAKKDYLIEKLMTSLDEILKD